MDGVYNLKGLALLKALIYLFSNLFKLCVCVLFFLDEETQVNLFVPSQSVWSGWTGLGGIVEEVECSFSFCHRAPLLLTKLELIATRPK